VNHADAARAKGTTTLETPASSFNELEAVDTGGSLSINAHRTCGTTRRANQFGPAADGDQASMWASATPEDPDTCIDGTAGYSRYGAKMWREGTGVVCPGAHPDLRFRQLVPWCFF